ncbi:uncharacterized protein EI97DRAFT_293803 [Westerdykella ornata]|uniref:Uncharacterized protein n=1 Tax=Westerdykella ornata TaxID=318751 RepID=A0A6A6JP80_WESOR|nr:uncharacterized protein EI97DRAFT_293803 [Westerdykella ornata]KAF2277486.1 hypothetical protein EI97DRAFT_293803 [Westerdykella ornata]
MHGIFHLFAFSPFSVTRVSRLGHLHLQAVFSLFLEVVLASSLGWHSVLSFYFPFSWRAITLVRTHLGSRIGNSGLSD